MLSLVRRQSLLPLGVAWVVLSACLPALAGDNAKHWSFQVPKRSSVPQPKETGWAKNPVDQFILAGLETVELKHSPEASRVELIRRVTYDLTGLPPSPAEVEAFLKDERPDAYERVVDRLLASPQYGERRAQFWLDLAHYGDTNGFELDAERPDAWRYRDWVVKAFNADMPYDRFVALQLAGDELEPGNLEALVATGFGRVGPREVVSGNIDPMVKRQSELTEVTGTVGSVVLGLTLGCARCHDHKSDPLPTTDFYGLQAFFAGAELLDMTTASKAEKEAYEKAETAAKEKTAPLRKRLAELEAPFRKALSDEKHAMLTPLERELMTIPEAKRTPAQKRLIEGLGSTLMVRWEEVAEAVAKNPKVHAEREAIKRAIYEVERTIPRPPAGVHALVDTKREAPETFVLRRGDVKIHGPKVDPHPPEVVLASMPGSFKGDDIKPTEKTPGRRKVLAAWVTRPDNPLTARVMVNRIWQEHFGKGIVGTPSDFGIRGELPTHPELLDWLACEFVASGWKIKAMHRLLVTSATYRQTSKVVGEPGQKGANDDPDNNYLWRMNRRRLDAEGLRDAMLAASGELNLKAGGPGVLAPIEKEVEDLIFSEAEVVDLWPETADPTEQSRRSIYLYRKRNVRYPMFDAFDAPDAQTPCPRRMVSTHALQALILLNSSFADARAKALAGRVLQDARGDDGDRLSLIYQITLGRTPKAEERQRDLAFLASQAEFLKQRAAKGGALARPAFVPSTISPPTAAAWVDLARAMLNRNEFIYVP